jgi:Transcriptional regulator, AbiEi antitoxin
MQHKLASVAARQGGAFTVHQALAAGYSRDAIRHRVESGRWSRPARGILTTGEPAAGGGADDLVRDAWVAVLSHPGAVVGHGVAAELHGIDTYRPVPGLELVRPVGQLRTPAYDGVKVTTAALPAGHLGEPRGVPATSLTRTAADLARRGSLRDGVVVLDSAMRLGCLRSELVAVVAACHGWPGSRSLRTALAVADEGAESPLESLAHVLHHEHGLPRAVTQVAMFDEAGFIGRVDDYWPGVATVGESDGLAKYDERGSLRREKLRQERLERAGLQVVRVTYADVTRNAEVTARRYREAFERGSQRLAWRPLDLRTVASPGERGRRAG